MLASSPGYQDCPLRTGCHEQVGGSPGPIIIFKTLHAQRPITEETRTARGNITTRGARSRYARPLSWRASSESARVGRCHRGYSSESTRSIVLECIARLSHDPDLCRAGSVISKSFSRRMLRYIRKRKFLADKVMLALVCWCQRNRPGARPIAVP